MQNFGLSVLGVRREYGRRDLNFIAMFFYPFVISMSPKCQEGQYDCSTIAGDKGEHKRKPACVLLTSLRQFRSQSVIRAAEWKVTWSAPCELPKTK